MIKCYDKAQTPYQRLIATGCVSDETQQELFQHYRSLNPLRLQRQIEMEVAHLWTLEAVDPASERAALAILAADLLSLR